MKCRGPRDHHFLLDRQFFLDRQEAGRSTGFSASGPRRAVCRRLALLVLGGSGLLLGGLTAGCGGPAADAPEAALASTTVSAPADQALTRGGKPATENSATSDSARELLDAVIARYRSADAYSDEGHVRLTYRRGGEEHVDQAPLAVSFDRRGSLHLRAYAADIVIHNQRLQAAITDPQTENMGRQRLDRQLTGPSFGLRAVYSDATLAHFATAGLGGPAPQLELLLSDQPLGGLFEQPAALRLEKGVTGGATGAAALDAVIIESDRLTYTLWIDPGTKLLRRVELPTEPTGLLSDPDVSDVRLTIELGGAAFSVPDGENWQLPPATEPIRVTEFVPPPPPLISPHLGRPMPKFQLSDPFDQIVIRNDAQDRPRTVLLWIADHPASEMAARQLQAIADRVPESISSETRFVLVMAEPSLSDPSATGKMLRRWKVGLPFVEDTDAVGRDAFNVREAPTLCVLGGPDAVMHWFYPRIGPEMSDQLPQLLSDLAEGKNVGQELRERYEQDQQTYQKLLKEVRR